MDIALKVITTVAAAASLVAVAVGCGGQSAQNSANAPPTPVAGTEPPTQVTAAQNQADQSVVAKLSSARCDHEQKCNNIGQGQKYASRDVCEAQLRSSTTSDLNAESCARGIDQGAVDRCMNAIGAEQCSPSIGTLSRLEDCRTGALCMK